MATIKSFPQVIFVKVQDDGDNDWLAASLTKRDALDDEPSAIIGTYQFVSAEEVSEGPTISKRRKTRAAK